MKIRHKYFIVFLILSISTFYIVDVPLWYDLTGGNSKYWKEYRNYGETIGFQVSRGTAVKTDWDFKRHLLSDINRDGVFDSVFIISSNHFTTFFGTINNKKEWFDRKVIYHDSDSIVFISKTYHRQKFKLTAEGVIYIGDSSLKGFVIDTFCWKRLIIPPIIVARPKDDIEDLIL